MIEKRVDDYVQCVRKGEIVACRYVRLACDRYLKDRDNASFDFDEDSAIRTVEFIEEWIFHTTGQWIGKPFKLLGWQLFVVWNLFGFKRRDDGTRRFRISFTEVARKQGKSTLAAAIGLYATVADRESRAETYSAATKKDQSKITWEEAHRMVRTSSELKRFVKTLAHSITVPETDSRFLPLGADSDTLDGLNIHCALVDEVHAHKSRNLWDVIVTATGARRQPLIFAITTAGFSRETLCYELHEHSVSILENRIDDDSFFAFICTLDEGDDWQDETVWAKPNPSLGVTVKIEDLREEAERAKHNPTAVNTFLRYKMNIWTESAIVWLTAEQWDACNHGPIDPEGLKGRKCIAGLDLASKRDTTALVLVFPPEKPGEPYLILPRIFTPGDSIYEKERRERKPWVTWMNEGLVITPPGEVIPVEFVLEQLAKDCELYDLKALVFDRWNFELIKPKLAEMGFEDPKEKPLASRHAIPMGQGYASMPEAIRAVEDLVLQQRLSHGGHRVLAWQVSCVELVLDEAGNSKFSKKRSSGKIDAVVAMTMAVFHAVIEGTVPEKRLTYNERAELLTQLKEELDQLQGQSNPTPQMRELIKGLTERVSELDDGFVLRY